MVCQTGPPVLGRMMRAVANRNIPPSQLGHGSAGQRDEGGPRPHGLLPRQVAC